MIRRTKTAVFWVCAALISPVAGAQTRPPTTFDKDLAPIVWSRCSSYHRPGQVGPFSLLTFEDVRPRAREILRAVNTRSMPPWKPELGYGEFHGDRRLPQGELAVFQRWA